MLGQFGSTGVDWGAFWPLRGLIGDQFGSTGVDWGTLWPLKRFMLGSWGLNLAPQGSIGAHSGPSGEPLGSLWAVQGLSGAHIGFSGRLRGLSGTSLGPTGAEWGGLGRPSAPPEVLGSHIWLDRGQLGRILAPQGGLWELSGLYRG